MSLCLAGEKLQKSGVQNDRVKTQLIFFYIEPSIFFCDRSKSWWQQRTSLEKTLTVICVLGVLLSIGLLVGLIVVAVQKDEAESVCVTASCIHESSQLFKHMNLAAKP